MNRHKRHIQFQPESDEFYSELRVEVAKYFEQNGKTTYGNKAMYFKILLFFIVFFLLYFSIYFVESNPINIAIIYSLMGVWGVFLGLNVGHDAAHNALFKTRKYNRWLLHVFDLIGTNSFNWKNRHVGAHHLYPNIMDLDSDIQQSRIVKIFPNDEHRKYHRLQFIYMPIVYMIYIFRWVVYRDFKDIFSSRLGGFDNTNYPTKEIVKMILFKAAYFLAMIGLPWLTLDLSLLLLLGSYGLLTVFASLTITMILLSTHVGENANFPQPNSQGIMPNSWSHHMMITAGDFATSSFLITHLFGGFNHHVIHHLFQHICHIHYPDLTRILIKVSTRHNISYRSEKYLLIAVLSHFKLLRNNGKLTPLNRA